MCKEEISKMDESFTKTRKSYVDLLGTMEKAFKDLGFSMKNLEKLREGYDKIPPRNDNEMEKFRLIIFNLKRRHEMFVELLKTCSNMSQYRDQLNYMEEFFNEINNNMKNSYSKLEYIINP